jgi:hypothetical protein
MNALGGGPTQAGAYFPQDEFYDAYMRELMAELANRARPNARVAGEISTLAAYYGQRANRPDLICVELSDPVELEKLQPGDFVIDARGRTYFTNQPMLTRLRQTGQPAFTIAVGATQAANVYLLDQKSLDALRGSR